MLVPAVEASPKSLPSIGENTVITLATKFVAFGFSLGTNVVIARLLGPAGQGIYSSAVLVWTLGTLLAGFGIGVTNTAFASQPGRKLSELLTNSLLFVTASSLVSGAAFIAMQTGLVHVQIGELTSSHINGVIAWVPLGVAVTALGGLMWGLNRLREWNGVFVLLGPVASFIALIIFAGGFRLGVPGAFAALMCGQAMMVLVGGWRLIQSTPLRLGWHPSLLKESLWYGIRANVAQLVGTLNFRFDSLLVLYFLGARDVGLYVVAVFVTEWLYFVPTSISVALFPRLGAAATKEEATQLTNRGLRVTLAISVVCVVAVAGAAPLLLRLFGESYLPALLTLVVLLPGVGIYALAHILTVYWNGYALKPEVNLGIALLSLLVDIVGVVVLVPRLGLFGAGLASSLAYIIAMLVYMVLYIRHARTTVRNAVVLTRRDVELLCGLFQTLRKQALLYSNKAFARTGQ